MKCQVSRSHLANVLNRDLPLIPATAALVGPCRQLYARADDKTECRNVIHLLRRCRGDGAVVRFSLGSRSVR